MSRIPSRMGERSRTNSAKLLARGAPTLAELKDEEEDDSPPSQSALKNTTEVMASEPTPDSDGGTVDPIKRTIPTVVPPPELAQQVPSQSQTVYQRPDREIPTENTYNGRPLKSKSSSQELADFFGSTSPPTTRVTPSDSNKSSSFKSFMSKVTGRRKEEERTSTPSPASTSQLRLTSDLSEPNAPQRKKSMLPVGTAQSASPMSQVPQNTQPPPNRGVLRKRSREIEGGVAGGVAIVGGASILNMMEEQTGTAQGAKGAPTTDPTQPAGSPTPVVPVDSPGRQQNADEAVRPTMTSLRSQSINSLSPLGSDMDQHDNSPSASASLASIRPGPADSMVSVSDANSFRAASLAPTQQGPADSIASISDANSFRTASLAPTRPGPADSMVSISDANSFRTAEEGESPIEEDRSIAETDTATEVGPYASAPISYGIPSETTPTTPSRMPSPSIPLADLVPLRSILQHATSAGECQLLLSAILTQWGVPQTVGGTSAAQLTPESRVTAWLLAGREGPIDAETHSSSTFSKVADDPMTPKQDDATRLPSVSTREPFNDGSDIEVLSSDRTNEVSLNREDNGENYHSGLLPSVAKSAERMSPAVTQPTDLGGQLPGAVDVITKGGVISAGI